MMCCPAHDLAHMISFVSYFLEAKGQGVIKCLFTLELVIMLLLCVASSIYVEQIGAGYNGAVMAAT